MTGHEGSIDAVKDAHRYSIGFTTSCSCGWQSGELRDREGLALIDHWQHLTDIQGDGK
jgi:hypothetical protein